MLLESGAPQINSIQTFDIAEGHRLKLDINHSYPKLEELQDTYFGEANITIVQLDGADSKFHTQNALLRTELEKEALALLHSLKHQEVKIYVTKLFLDYPNVKRFSGSEVDY